MSKEMVRTLVGVDNKFAIEASYVLKGNVGRCF